MSDLGIWSPRRLPHCLRDPLRLEIIFTRWFHGMVNGQLPPSLLFGCLFFCVCVWRNTNRNKTDFLIFDYFFFSFSLSWITNTRDNRFCGRAPTGIISEQMQRLLRIRMVCLCQSVPKHHVTCELQETVDEKLCHIFYMWTDYFSAAVFFNQTIERWFRLQHSKHSWKHFRRVYS